MKPSGLGSRDPVIAYAPEDGSVRVFEDFEEREGHLAVVGVLEREWSVFYGLDGQVLAPKLNQHNWVVRLIPTETHDLPGLIELLTSYAGRHGFDADGTDPVAFVNEMWRRNHDARWPKWPRWLDRWLRGGPPSAI